MATELKVELRDHMGQKKVKFGTDEIEVDIDFAQCSIMVNGREIGLVCKKPGSPINFLPPANVFPPEARKQIAEAVKTELEKVDGGSERKVFDPPSEEAVAAANEAIAKQAAAENGESGSADETNL